MCKVNAIIFNKDKKFLKELKKTKFSVVKDGKVIMSMLDVDKIVLCRKSGSNNFLKEIK